MKSILEFLKTTLISGAIFLLPIILVLVILGKAIHVITTISHPMANIFHVKHVWGIAAADLMTAVFLLLAAFLCGLFARTGLARKLREFAENLILAKIPAYNVVKSMAQDVDGMETRDDWEVALANIDEAWLLSFIVERNSNGMLTVFIPSAPTPAAGSLYFLKPEQVKPLDIPVAAAVKCIKHLGAGSSELLSRAVF
jgi:uncharacterized membrane protein